VSQTVQVVAEPASATLGSDDPGFDAEVCLIGAGAAGLAAGKALADRGIAFDWFEKGSMVGGLWRIDNDNGGVAAYKTLHLNSSRPLTQYPSYPMPADWPDYPPHEMVAAYFQGFAEDNHLLERITFRTEVTSVEPLPGDGLPGSHGWSVTTADGEQRTYRAVMVANGHHGAPNVPEFPGEFTGETLHAHDYRDPVLFTDKDVVVVGVGNSGMDIACDAAKVAHRVYLVTRHGVHVIPKYAFGRPVDQLGNPLMGYIPFPVERTLYETIMRISTGRPEDRGLPKPDHRLLHAHPTVSAELYDRVGHGDITMKPGIELLDGQEIRFSDGTSVHADVLVHATGYRITLPFLAPEVYDPTHNAMPLYQRVVSPDRPGLFFIGFIQTVGANIPLYEYQAQWIGDVLTGDAALPSPDEMRDWIVKDQKAMAARYLRSDRHTMQVDYWRYIRAMKEARARKSHPSLVDRLTRPLAGLR
jgi:dimethylaniline monooxygenase (N-oxide forming)